MAKPTGRNVYSPSTGQPCPLADFGYALAATQTLIENKQHGRSIAVLCIDIHGFRRINHSFGLQVGTAVLDNAWQRMQQIVRKEDHVYRTGDDEFVLVLGSILHEEHAVIAAQRVQRLFDDPMVIADEDMRISVCIGISVYPDPASDASELFRQASQAMHDAKVVRDGYLVYRNDANHDIDDPLLYTRELQQAIADNEIVFYLQPQYEFKANKFIGAEALARWPRPGKGLTSAEEFVPLLEQAGSTRSLTNLALNTTLRQWANWDIDNDLTVSINLSMQDISDPELPELIRRSLGVWRVDAGRLELEVTETVMMSDLQQTVSVLSALSEIGVSIAIDDFGSGYSSLSYLQKLPVDNLKIDKQFIVDIQPDSKDLVLVEAIINLAHNFGLKVTAEGVETETGFRLLRELGCDLAQGHFVSPPLPPEHWQEQVISGSIEKNLST